MSAVQEEEEAAGVISEKMSGKGTGEPESEERDSADMEMSVPTARRVTAKINERAQRWFCCQLVTMEGL